MKTVVLISVLLMFTQAQIGFVASDTCCKTNQIQVSGEGKASALPDMAIISIRFN
jgi:uncharacterized protein YggE